VSRPTQERVEDGIITWQVAVYELHREIDKLYQEKEFLVGELAALQKKYDSAAFWSGWVYPEGATAEQVQAELHDFRSLMHHVPNIYDHVTGGRISKPNAMSATVISAHDDYVTELVDEAVKESQEESNDIIADLNKKIAKLIEAREFSALASATLRDESIEHQKRANRFETVLYRIDREILADKYEYRRWVAEELHRK
jgi:hypothetical protein